MPGVGLVDGKFIDENTTTGRVGSLIPCGWGNAVTDEILNVIKAGGMEPDEAVTTQLSAAIKKMVGDGAVKFASQPVVNAGEDDTQAVSSKKFAAAARAQVFSAFTTGGAAGSLTLAPAPAISAYSAPLRFRIKFSQSSTGADTLNVSGQGAKSIKQYDSTGAKVAAVFAANQLADVEYDGADFVLLDQLPSGTTKNPTFESLELRGLEPYIDFSNDTTSDFDARIVLLGDDVLDILGVGNTGLRVGGATVITTAAAATEAAAGISKIATAAVAVAGSNDTDMMTALKTKQSMPFTSVSGVATLKLPNGYIQQIFDVTESVSASDYKFFPVSFPTECLGVFLVLLSTTSTGYGTNAGIVVGDITKDRFLIAAGTNFSTEGRFRAVAIGR